MRIIGALIAGALCTLTAPAAAAQSPAPTWRLGMYEGAPACFAVREEAGGVTLALIANQSGRYWAAVGYPGWRAEEDETYEIGFAIDKKRPAMRAAKGVRSMGRAGFLAEVNSGFFGALGRAKTLHVTVPGARPMPLNLAGAADAAARLKSCYKKLHASVARPPATRADAPTWYRDPFRGDRPFPRRAVGELVYYFSADDYPAASMRNREQGRTSFRLQVGPNGRVTSCSILRSSGSAALDSTTCAILQRRAGLLPALDAEGKPVPDTVRGTIEWKLPK